MYILVAYPEHPHGMRDANIPLYIPGISLGWRVLVGEEEEGASEQVKRGENQIFGVKHHENLHGGKTRKPHLDIYI
jgi:hypothetical protein